MKEEAKADESSGDRERTVAREAHAGNELWKLRPAVHALVWYAPEAQTGIKASREEVPIVLLGRHECAEKMGWVVRGDDASARANELNQEPYRTDLWVKGDCRNKVQMSEGTQALFTRDMPEADRLVHRRREKEVVLW